MAVKSVVLRMIFDNRGSIVAIFRCAVVVDRNIIVTSVVIVSTIFVVIIIYGIGYAVVVIIVIGRIMVEIIVMVMNIIMGDHCPCCLACIVR